MVELNVCVGSGCHVKGSYNVIQTFLQLIEAQNLHGQVEMKAQFCMNNCQSGVSVALGGTVYSVSPETAKTFFENTVVPKTKE